MNEEPKKITKNLKSAIVGFSLLTFTFGAICCLCSMQIRHYKHNSDKIIDDWTAEGMEEDSLSKTIDKVSGFIVSALLLYFLHSFLFLIQLIASVFMDHWQFYKHSLVELIEIGFMGYYLLFPALYDYIDLALSSISLWIFVSVPLAVFLFFTSKKLCMKEQFLYTALIYNIIGRIGILVLGGYRTEIFETDLPIHKYNEIEDELRNKIIDVAAAHGVRKEEIIIREDNTINASATKGFNYRFVFIHTGAIKAFNDDQLMSVVWHELGHVKYNHTIQRTFVKIIYSSTMLGITFFFPTEK